ncbi:MAG: FtsX-like permease family protein [Rhodobacterales bacterium]|nr:FtsX-like permease family protein [Rhodobacterales bacterium]
MSPLRRKMLRDLWRLRAQALAIALVLAAGVATLILGTGAHQALSDTRARYYEDHRFADVFADLTRAPRALLAEIAALDGVLAAEGRVVKPALTDMPGMAEPGSVLLVSLPGPAGLNRLHLRQGRLPDPQAAQEVAVSEGFATAHRLRPGSTVTVLMNGRHQVLQVTGIALSPEFVYALGPGEMMPDPRRFGILWAPAAALEAAFDLEGAFSNLVLKLAPGADAARVIAALDSLLERYGGQGARGREDQVSHAFLQAELTQLGAMVRVLPPIFLAVAAMLVNMTLSRLVALEREQIGLLKAIGYGPRAIARHYVEFVLVIAAVGIVLGLAAGAWMGAELAQIYARFFSFPYLVFSRDPQMHALAAAVAAAAAAGGAVMAVRGVVALPPAVAMTPPAPAVYRAGRLDVLRRLFRRRTATMAARQLTHRPLRTAGSVVGVGLAVAILVASLWSFGSIERMIEVTFFRADRQDAQLVLTAPAPARALLAVRQMPGVMTAEPFRSVPAVVSHRQTSRRLALTGRPAEARLSRVLALDLTPMAMPDAGLILSEALARALGVGRGDLVTVDLLDGPHRRVSLRVSGISLGYVGLQASLEIGALNRLMDEGAVISGVHLTLDPAQRDAFFAAARAAPATGVVTLTDLTVTRFRETLAENILVMVTVYVTLAAIIAVGVVYNLARIALSEQGRDLASLRVLGFTRAEVSGVLYAQLAAVVVLAQPVGWLMGWAMAAAMVAAFSSDLYRVPFVLDRSVFATASLIVCTAAAVSALAVRGRIDRLDLIAVLKTRE